MNCELESTIFPAIRWDQLEVIRVLANRECDSNRLNHQSSAPFAAAVRFQSTRLVGVRLDCMATRNVSDAPDGAIDLLTTHILLLVNQIERVNRPTTADKIARTNKDVRSGESLEIANPFDLGTNNQATLLKEKIEQGINPNTMAVYIRKNLLHAAVAYGASECVICGWALRRTSTRQHRCIKSPRCLWRSIRVSLTYFVN
jgi:hypothetical protein